jgi:hypothetical protein
LCGCKSAAERRLGHVVDERALALDLDDGQPLAVARLELGVSGDLDLLELEPELRAQRFQLAARPLAEVTALGGVEPDRGYG